MLHKQLVAMRPPRGAARERQPQPSPSPSCQVVVVHREELLVKARRACVLPPSNDASITSLNQHLLKTLIDGAHLCPLPPEEAAVYWENDHAMWLHPSPDVLVLADRQHQFQHTCDETARPRACAPSISTNPGPDPDPDPGLDPGTRRRSPSTPAPSPPTAHGPSTGPPARRRRPLRWREPRAWLGATTGRRRKLRRPLQ